MVLAMIEIKVDDRFPIHRCIYCKDQGEENMFILSGRWDKNPKLDPENIIGTTVTIIIGTTVTMDGDMFEILYDDSSPKLGAPTCFQLVAKRLTRIDKIKRLRKETGAGLYFAKTFLEEHGYAKAKQMLQEGGNGSESF